MLDWLPRLYYFLPILCGDDGPFRLCAPNNGDLPARHDMPSPAEVDASFERLEIPGQPRYLMLCRLRNDGRAPCRVTVERDSGKAS